MAWAASCSGTARRAAARTQSASSPSGKGPSTLVIPPEPDKRLRVMSSGTIIRVFCVDGPCHGEQDLNLDTGRVVFDGSSAPPHHVYRIDPDERIGIRSLPTAYFDHDE
jgi:hypothetical protein